MNVICAFVGNRVAALEGEEPLPLGLESHAASCLRCQAEKARDRRLRRALSELALQTVSAPIGLVASVERAIAARRDAAIATSPSRRDVPTRRFASPGTIAGMAAFAAGGAAVAAWRLTKRPA